MSSRRGETNSASSVPRALIHKKILSVAESRPDASIESLAAEVTGASADLVERVLDEYGDPSTEVAETTTAVEDEPDASDGAETIDEAETTDGAEPTDGVTTTESMSNAAQHQTDGDVGPTELTEKQRGLLAEIERRPEATQRDLAEHFDVSQATISKHLNAIDGFDWAERRSFVDAVHLDGEAVDGWSSTQRGAGRGGEQSADAADSSAGRTAESGSDGDVADDETFAQDDGPTDPEASAKNDTAAEGAPSGDETAGVDDADVASGDIDDEDETPTETREHPESASVTDELAALRTTVADLADRLETLETHLAKTSPRHEHDDRADPVDSQTEREKSDDTAANGEDAANEHANPFEDPELSAKVIQVCVHADTIDDDEERQIIQKLVAGSEPTN